MKEKKSGISTGISAEYFVAGELTRRGFNVSITLKNTPNIDILVTDKTNSKMFFIQVKAKHQLNKSGDKKWLLTSKDEVPKGDNFFYAFVNMNNKDLSPPDIYIVSSNIVSKEIKKGYKNFIKRGGNKNPIRQFHIKGDLYLNNYDVFK